MASPPSPIAAQEEVDWWAVDRATGLPEVWALVAKHLGLVGAWRLMRVGVASRAGAKDFLSTLPGLVVCGGRTQFTQGGEVRDVRRLDLATLRWEPMPALVSARYNHACCAVRGTVVVLGGGMSDISTSRVEMLSEEEGEGAFVNLPPLLCNLIRGAAAIAVEESESAAGQVILLDGMDELATVQSAVHLVDLATRRWWTRGWRARR